MNPTQTKGDELKQHIAENISAQFLYAVRGPRTPSVSDRKMSQHARELVGVTYWREPKLGACPSSTS